MVLLESAPVGAKVAVVPVYDTIPEIWVLPCITTNVEELIVVESIDSLNVATTLVLSTTSVAPSAGLVEVTEGTLVARIDVTPGRVSQPTRSPSASSGLSHDAVFFRI